MVHRVSYYALLLSIIATAALLFALIGCEGGGVTTGCVTGWVYTNAEGDVIISANRVPPEGYEPVEGAPVQIEGYPDLTDITDANGRYVICCVPPGTQTILVTVDEEEVRFEVQVQAGRVTVGGGHSEGGGGL